MAKSTPQVVKTSQCHVANVITCRNLSSHFKLSLFS